MILITREGKRVAPLRFGEPDADGATNIVVGIDLSLTPGVRREFNLQDFVAIEGSFSFAGYGLENEQ